MLENLFNFTNVPPFQVTNKMEHIHLIATPTSSLTVFFIDCPGMLTEIAIQLYHFGFESRCSFHKVVEYLEVTWLPR